MLESCKADLWNEERAAAAKLRAHFVDSKVHEEIDIETILTEKFICLAIFATSGIHNFNVRSVYLSTIATRNAKLRIGRNIN